MKKVKNRAFSALLLAVLIICGMVLYCIRFADSAADWATFGANQNIYQGGLLTSGTIYDRSGIVLASAEGGERSYAENAQTRIANLHTTGDFEGNIGTGALSVFADKLSGYSPITGLSGKGGEMTLTVDSSLNETAYAALAGRSGAVMVMDYTTGEVLCMVSSPSYDPNVGFDASSSYYDGVYLNRAISSAFTPGSVFKLVTMAAAIDNIPDLYSRTFTCQGQVDVGGITVTCTGWHGEQTIEQALANSCNCAFAQISLELGADTLKKYADDLGFTSQHDISGAKTAAGSFDKAASGSADLAWSGIGQYTDLVCPYSMLRYVAAIANGGEAVTAKLNLDERSAKTRLLSSDTAERISEMMLYNVTAAYGEWTFPGLKMAAKSGTAEVGDGTSHAWFTGFLADDEHPYAFVVVIEHGGGGLKNAGAVANTVLQAAVSKN